MRGLKISFAIGIVSTGMDLIVTKMFQKWERLNPAAIAGGGGA